MAIAYTPSRPPLPTPSTSLASSTCSHTPGTPGSDDSFTTFRTVDTGDQTSYIVLPYDIQHSILPRVQTLLEHTFFSFLDKHAPHVLVSKGWDTPTAAELTTYTRDLRWILFSDRSLEPLFPPTWGSGDTSNILRQLDEIRHVSVHRRPVTFEKLLCLLDSASSAASLFWDGGAGEDYWEIVHIKESAQYWMDNIDKSRGIAEEDCARERFELERTVAGKISRMEAEKRERIMEAERLGVKCLRMAFWYSGSAKGFEMGSEESG